jgi:hypothetical protein
LCNWIMKLSLCKRLPLFQKLIRFWSIAINKLLFILVNPFRLFEANFDPFRRLTSPQKQNNITWAVSKNPDNEEPIPTRTKIAGPSQISSWVVVLSCVVCAHVMAMAVQKLPRSQGRENGFLLWFGHAAIS